MRSEPRRPAKMVLIDVALSVGEVRPADEAVAPGAIRAGLDAGPRHGPMARRLEAAGAPVFRTADRDLRFFRVFCEALLASE